MGDAGFSGEVAKSFGLRRTRAINAMKSHIDSGGATPLPDDLNPDDFRCDAEQVEINEKGKVVKSSKSFPNIS